MLVTVSFELASYTKLFNNGSLTAFNNPYFHLPGWLVTATSISCDLVLASICTVHDTTTMWSVHSIHINSRECTHRITKALNWWS